MTEQTETKTETTSSAPTTRDEMRARIFGAKAKSQIVEDFFGCTIELRQPTLEVALAKRDDSAQDRIYSMLTDYAFVPGSGEKIFSEEDIDNIRTLPFGEDFNRLINAVNSLLGIDPAEVEAQIKAQEKSA